MSNFDERFMKDEELHSLLEQWKAPDAPQSLDNRVTAAYNSLMGDAAARLDSVLNPMKGREVVTMKFCKTCQEEFADRFSFCPVDGTPLSAAFIPLVPDASSGGCGVFSQTSTPAVMSLPMEMS